MLCRTENLFDESIVSKETSTDVKGSIKQFLDGIAVQTKQIAD